MSQVNLQNHILQVIKVTQHKRKVLQFIGFYHNVAKAFMVLLLTRMRITFCIYIDTQNDTYKIGKEKFHGLLKTWKNHEISLLCNC